MYIFVSARFFPYKSYEKLQGQYSMNKYRNRFDSNILSAFFFWTFEQIQRVEAKDFQKKFTE